MTLDELRKEQAAKTKPTVIQRPTAVAPIPPPAVMPTRAMELSEQMAKDVGAIRFWVTLWAVLGMLALVGLLLAHLTDLK